MNEDLQYLKLLSIFHYIVGGMAALFAFIPIIYVVVGMLAFYIPGPLNFDSEAMPAFIGWILTIIGTGLIALGWAFSACIIIAGRYLARQAHYMFCMVMAAVECIFMPFGISARGFHHCCTGKAFCKGIVRADRCAQANRRSATRFSEGVACEHKIFCKH